jgi:hypothetical protein
MKTDKDIENLLMSGKKLSLSVHDKVSIKTTLLEHAAETLKHDVCAIPSPWTSWVTRGAVSFASLLIVFVGTAYASQGSLPGEPLYAIKVHVLEDAIALTKLDPQERAEYDVSLMERRLDELKALQEDDTAASTEELTELTDQIAEHVADVTETVNITNEKITHEDKIDILAKVSSVAKAQSDLADNEKDFAAIVDTVQSSEDDASDALSDAVEDFTNQKPADAVNAYLGDQIAEVSDQITASSTDPDTRDDAEQHLHDAEEALVDGDTTEAITSVLQAQQEITADKYLDEPLDSE